MGFLSQYMSSEEKTLLFFLCVSLAVLFGAFLYLILRNPYHYPYFYHEFDVSGKRNIDIDNYIDTFLNNPYNWQKLQQHMQIIENWKYESKQHADNSVLKNYRNKQLLAATDDEHAFCFQTIRLQTRYKQVNYVKSSYKVAIPHSAQYVNWAYLKQRYARLRAIGFESTLKEYERKNQRSLMTPALKNKIKLRDNFTCQICGKYMPDEVGLHIDHIVPIASGGKSIPSNLQVLCSKCNGRKGKK